MASRCALGPCVAYLKGARRREACEVCWLAEQDQPSNTRPGEAKEITGLRTDEEGRR